MHRLATIDERDRLTNDRPTNDVRTDLSQYVPLSIVIEEH